MKKNLLFILALCMLVSFAACGNGGQKEPAAPASNIKAWAFHGFDKTVVNVAPKGNFSTDYTVYLAKGETEGCQVAVYSDKEIKNATLTEKSGKTDNIEVFVYSMERTHKVVKKNYTDALIPYKGKAINVAAKTTLPFMIEFKTNENTVAGEYKYVYEFKDESGAVLAFYNITVHVWDFEIPKEKTFATSANIRSDFIAHYGVYNEEVYAAWYEMLLEHNLSAYRVPYGIFDERAEKYMSDPRVTSFIVDIPTDKDYNILEDELAKVRSRLMENPEWIKKAYFLPIDEPHTKEQLVKLREWERQLTKLCPEIEIMAPYYTNIKLEDGRDQTDDMAEYTDLWCPKLCLWDDERSYGDFLDYTPSKSFEERMNDQIAKGDRMWSYVCNDPDDPYAQLFIDTEGVNQRLMFWQMYQRDIEGFLYWAVNYYGYKGDADSDEGATPYNPWEISNPNMTDGNGIRVYGEGYLFYPGNEVRAGLAVSSIRAKIVRDGIDDIELFYLAEKYLGKEWLVNKTKEGTPTLTEYVSGDKFASLRIEIGNALEAALKK